MLNAVTLRNWDGGNTKDLSRLVTRMPHLVTRWYSASGEAKNLSSSPVT
jgi:hypothetical protein